MLPARAARRSPPAPGEPGGVPGASPLPTGRAAARRGAQGAAPRSPWALPARTATAARLGRARVGAARLQDDRRHAGRARGAAEMRRRPRSPGLRERVWRNEKRARPRAPTSATSDAAGGRPRGRKPGEGRARARAQRKAQRARHAQHRSYRGPARASAASRPLRPETFTASAEAVSEYAASSESGAIKNSPDCVRYPAK